MAAPVDCAAPDMPLDFSEGFADWAAGVLRAQGVSDQAISAMREGIRESELDGEVFLQGGPHDRELREGMRLPELPAIGEPRGEDHARRVLDGLAWRILHAAAAGRGRMGASSGKVNAWVRRMLPGCKGVCDVVEVLGGAVCELEACEAGLLVPGDEVPSKGLLVRLGRMVSCLRSAAVRGCGLPDAEGNVTVCVIGNTGAGKSTLLNALLGEESLLPTNAMRACTAAIIEIVYNLDFSGDSVSHTAEIRFIPKDEWAAFVREAFQVLVEGEGGKAGNDVEEMADGADQQESLTNQLKSKLYAAYGKDIDLTAGPEALLQKGGRINALLGTTISLGAASGKELREKYEQYVDSSNEASEGAAWPIVQRVILKGPWDLLCGGLRLVDAPGLQDDNSARDQVVRSYMRQADSVWLVSNIRRATSDKTTMDMMPAGFLQVLKEKGVPGSLAYIATQTDVMLRSEVIQNLSDRLSETSTQLECAVARNDFFKATMEEKVLRSRGAHGIAAEMKGAADEQGASNEHGRFEFASFAVSAVDYQKIKGIRRGDGGAAVFLDEKGTEIPKLQEFLLQCAPALRRGKFKAGGALLDYLAQAKAKAAREEEAARAELELRKTCRSKFKQAFDLFSISPPSRFCHSEMMVLQQFFGPSTNPIPFRLPSLMVKDVGFIGLPLSSEQAETLLKHGTAWNTSAGNRVTIIEGKDVSLDPWMMCSAWVRNFPPHFLLEMGLGQVQMQITSKVNSLLLAEAEAPFAAFSHVPQHQGSFGRLVVQLPSFYESYGLPSIRVAHKGVKMGDVWGGMRSVGSFFRLITFSECEISWVNEGSSRGIPGRGLFLVYDLLCENRQALPYMMDRSDAAAILSTAIRGMRSDQREKLAMPLSASVTAAPLLSQLVGWDRERMSLLLEQTHLDVGFVVLTKQKRTFAAPFFEASEVFGLNGNTMGFKFDFPFISINDIKDDEDRAVYGLSEHVCRDIILVKDSHSGDADLFQGAHKTVSDRRWETLTRVVAVFWPRENTPVHTLLSGGFSRAMDTAEQLLKTNHPSSEQALQALSESFVVMDDDGQTATRAIRMLGMFASSGGIAVDAAGNVIRSLAMSGSLRRLTLTEVLCKNFLKFFDLYSTSQGIKDSFVQIFDRLKPEQLNEHVVVLACDDLAARNFFVEESLVLSILREAQLEQKFSSSSLTIIHSVFTRMSRRTENPEHKRKQLRVFVSAFLRTCSAVDSAVEILTPTLEVLGFSDAFRTYVDVRRELMALPGSGFASSLGHFTKAMYQIMASTAGSYTGTKLAEKAAVLTTQVLPSDAAAQELTGTLVDNLLSIHFADRSVQSQAHVGTGTASPLENLISHVASSSELSGELPGLLRKHMSASSFFDFYKGLASKPSLRGSLRPLGLCFDASNFKDLAKSKQLGELAKIFCTGVPDNEPILQNLHDSLLPWPPGTKFNALAQIFIPSAVREATSKSLLELARLYLAELKKRPDAYQSFQETMTTCVTAMQARISSPSGASTSAQAQRAVPWAGMAAPSSASHGPPTAAAVPPQRESPTAGSAPSNGRFAGAEAAPAPSTPGSAAQGLAALSEANSRAHASLGAEAAGEAGRGTKRRALQPLSLDANSNDANAQRRRSRRDGGCQRNQGSASGQGPSAAGQDAPVVAHAAPPPNPPAAGPIVIDLTGDDD